MSTEEKKRVFRSAVTTFLFGASVVIGAAFIYCVQTSNTLGLALLTGAVTVMAGIIYVAVRSEG